ncbi:MAG: hypothetical protein KC442_23365 [Thermomicrobiales bacterium]|nr:hypothetical protein [Thermomicrobiales bacterium]
MVDFSVQLVAVIDGALHSVARYDCSHGQPPHRDVLNWDGSTARKSSMRPGISNNQALNEAVDDFLDNWKRYVRDYLRRWP